MPISLVYGIVLFIVFFLARNYEKHKHKKFLKNSLFLLLLLIYGLRFDTTADYFNYVLVFNFVKYDVPYLVEYGYRLLNYIFSGFEFGYIYVLLISSFLCFLSLHHFLLRKNVLKWGYFFSFCFGLIQMYNNQVRQSIALSIFIWSIKYIEEGVFVKYLGMILLAFMFHVSAIVLIPFYYICRYFSRVNISVFWLIFIQVLFYVFYVSGTFTTITYSFFSIIPKYQTYANQIYGQAASLNSGFGIVFWLIISCIICLFKSKIGKENRIFVNMTFLATLMFFFLNDFPIMERIVRYFYIFRIVAIAILMSNIGFTLIKAFVFTITISFGGFKTFNYYKGGIYKTVFCDDRRNSIFYDRHWKEEGGNNDRKDKIKIEKYTYRPI